MAWTDPGIRKLAEQFIPAADEVKKLERGSDAASRFFQKIAKRHLRGVSSTQGTYLVTPSGILLDSGHTLNANEMVPFLETGLKKWKGLSGRERIGRGSGGAEKVSKYPVDGLVLSVVLRKFYAQKPRGRLARGIVEWNQDFAWFRKEEAAQFFPSRPRKGSTHDLPDALVSRLARYHFTDTVRAFADPFPTRCVKEARLTSTVLSVKGDVVSLRFNGVVRSTQDDLPRIGRSRDQVPIPRHPHRSFEATLLGYGTFDLGKKRFTSFEIVALGTQSGGGARGSKDPVTMGVALTLARDTPVGRVEPLHLSLYGWK